MALRSGSGDCGVKRLTLRRRGRWAAAGYACACVAQRRLALWRRYLWYYDWRRRRADGGGVRVLALRATTCALADKWRNGDRAVGGVEAAEAALRRDGGSER